ncbi:hypothetical protein VTN96DRAFT_3290 [Rasamsonia emersonii]
MDNIENVQATQGVNNASSLAGIEAVLTAIIDDAMVAFASAQIMLLQDTAPTPVVIQSPAYAFGTPRYIYTVMFISIVITTGFFVEALRTRDWRRLSKFDFMDVKSVIVAASGGGTAKEAQKLHHSQGSRWHAASDDELVGSIYVRLERGEEGGVAVSLSERRRPRVYTGLVGMSADDFSTVPLREMAQPMGES